MDVGSFVLAHPATLTEALDEVGGHTRVYSACSMYHDVDCQQVSGKI